MFETEQEMSFKFEKFLKYTFGNAYFKEYQGLFGIPDFIFYSKIDKEVCVISFELKLKDWRRAAMQAFRYNNFSNISYVVLPVESIKSAMANIELFRKYNIGLASFDVKEAFQIIYKPENREPFSEALNQKVIKSAFASKRKSKNIEVLL
jgi:hypothetical protein